MLNLFYFTLFKFVNKVSKYCYVSVTIQLKISHLLTQLNVNTVVSNDSV